MMIRLRRLLLCAAAGLPLAAIACGVCVEDRIAAVYDHALVTRTQQLKQKMLYLAWDGAVSRDVATRQRLLDVIGSVVGITLGSVRVSTEPASIALAFDPAKTTAEKIEATLQAKLSKFRMYVTPLQATALK